MSGDNCLKKQKEKKEGFDNSNPLTGGVLTAVVTHLVVVIIAVYVSFKCNDGINIIELIIAFWCPYCYLLYRLFAGCKK